MCVALTDIHLDTSAISLVTELVTATAPAELEEGSARKTST
jgi:hypothetical protein